MPSRAKELTPTQFRGLKHFDGIDLHGAKCIATAMVKIRRDGMGPNVLAFQAMTATRSGAIRFAKWDKIDLAAKVWTIQPGRKASMFPASDSAKRIPLTD
ncbi:hypothetical protein [uncultured Sulfitobacter sp.]|uniref:hypothetical protein n=1 Tax=uncultured Sulfitobacter sp. TaxID=191468 RepID=UPI002610B71B|nr:hypothetical protein [uncultured Sulfitobacter sp.]